MDIAPAAVLIASIEDLLSMKRAANRDKDKLDVESLDVIKRLKKRLR